MDSLWETDYKFQSFPTKNNLKSTNTNTCSLDKQTASTLPHMAWILLLIRISILLHQQKIESLQVCFVFFFSDLNCKSIKTEELTEGVAVYNTRAKDALLTRTVKQRQKPWSERSYTQWFNLSWMIKVFCTTHFSSNWLRNLISVFNFSLSVTTLTISN